MQTSSELATCNFRSARRNCCCIYVREYIAGMEQPLRMQYLLASQSPKDRVDPLTHDWHGR